MSGHNGRGGPRPPGAPRPSNTPAPRSRLPLIWLVPVAALVIGGYFLVTTLLQRGPEITVTFNSAQSLAAGTKVMHKAVELGTVTSLELTQDLGHARAHIRMTSDAAPFLTEKTRFWVVRPQVSGGSVSGLTTLISGSYIEMDPGARSGTAQTDYTGLEDPPGVRLDEPGTTYVLHAPTVASLASGTRVFFRDAWVGEVLNRHIEEGTAEITAEVFVRSPYDKRVRTGTVWWQYSGVDAAYVGNGIHVAVTSVQAALSGAVAFGVPPGAPDYPLAPGGTNYPMFSDEDTASRASYSQRIPYVVYLTDTDHGPDAGTPVLLYGTQVGEVTGVRLLSSPLTGAMQMRVAFNVLPTRMKMIGDDATNLSVPALGEKLARAGMQASLTTTSYVTNKQALALDLPAVPPRDPAQTVSETGVIVLPASGGSAMTSSAASLVNSLNDFPYQSTGQTISAALAAFATVAKGIDGPSKARALSATLASARASIQSADASLTPILRELPADADSLDRQLKQADQALASIDDRFGSASTLQQSVARKLADYYDTIRYTRLLADYLARHPEAIARGTTGYGAER
ncbi:intermembrane transport protein PqiB [Acidisphaera sp. L21]|uniref:PqiB family protein n=1 Tax=Acidisphaera sp. L21 TaxID=1641851 RepID=UPI00131E67CE|nr:MlaD family protein [Acidisphaera sp. L21]